jgi:hypothetical protein
MKVKRQTTITQQWLVRILCAIALLFVGFAHQPPVIQTSAGPIDVSQYVLPDGSLPIFCITDNSDDGTDHGRMHMVHGCEACQIAASVVVPAPSDVPGFKAPMSTAVSFHGAENDFSRPLFPPNIGPTGPPQSATLA